MDPLIKWKLAKYAKIYTQEALDALSRKIEYRVDSIMYQTMNIGVPKTQIANPSKSKKQTGADELEPVRKTEYKRVPPIVEVSSNFGERKHPVHGKVKFHNGVDISVGIGTPVHTISDGIINFAGTSGPSGKNVRVLSADGMIYHSFSHLSEVKVSEGQVVKKNQIVGLSGNTGSSTGPHVHFVVRQRSLPKSKLQLREPTQEEISIAFAGADVKYRNEYHDEGSHVNPPVASNVTPTIKGASAYTKLPLSKTMIRNQW